jgi:hypothetical protein
LTTKAKKKDKWVDVAENWNKEVSNVIGISHKIAELDRTAEQNDRFSYFVRNLPNSDHNRNIMCMNGRENVPNKILAYCDLYIHC